MDKLTENEIKALREFKRSYGRSWKRELSDLWMKASAGQELQAVRNKIGPSGLQKLKI